MAVTGYQKFLKTSGGSGGGQGNDGSRIDESFSGKKVELSSSSESSFSTPGELISERGILLDLFLFGVLYPHGGEDNVESD
ncbi:hypothetical protein Tco_0562583 [Tanacetum coccineum]